MEVVQGIQKQIAFGYRLVNVGKRWTKYNQTANLHEHIHLRCVLWTTNPADRNVDQVGLSLKQVSPKANRTVLTPPGQTTIVLRMIEHYELAELDTEMNPVECFAKFRQSQTYYATINGPKVVCKSSAYLSARPLEDGSYARSTVIECFTNSSCSSISFRWSWLAGPVPPVTIETYDWHHINYSHGRFLYLSALPRGGTYLFRCVAHCRCGTKIIPLTFTHRITVDYNFDDMKQLESSNPGDVELRKIEQGQSKENSDTLESSIKRWEQSESEPFANLETEEHMSIMPRPSQPISTEHIAVNETQITYQPKYPKYMSEETFRDTGNAEFLENLDHYAIRRVSDNYVRVVSPEKQFVRMDPQGKRLFPEFENHHDESYLAHKLETLKRIHRMKNQFHQMRTHSSGGRETGATYHRTWPPSDEHINEVLDVPIDKTEKHKVSLSSRRTSILYGEGNLTLSQLATETATRFLKTDMEDWLLLKRKQLSKRRILHLKSDNFDFEKDGSSRYALTLTLNTSSSPNEEMLDKVPGYSQRDHEDVPVGFVRKTGDNVVLSEKPLYEERVISRNRMGSRKHYISRSLINDKHRTYSDQVRIPMHTRRSKRELFGPRKFADYGPDSYLDSRGRTGKLTFQELSNLTWNTIVSESPLRKLRRDRHFELPPRLFYPTANVYSIEPESLRSVHHSRTGFRDYVPTERLDVNIYEKDKVERKTPWWTRLLHWQTFRYIRQGVAPVHHVHSPDPPTFQPNQFRDSDDPVGWTRYLNQLRDYEFTQLISSSESNVSEKLKENAFSNEVQIKPGFVILPGSTTALCPSLLPNKNSSYYLSTLEWYRCTSLNEQKQEILGISLDQHRLYLGSNRYQNSTRVYAYPPLRWTHTYTLDIDRLHIPDYGFYGCVNWYLSDSLEKTIIKSHKISSHPLCLMSKQANPKLKIWRSEEVTLQQMFKWLTSKNGTDSLNVEQTDRTSNRTVELGCLKPGQKLIVACTVNSYRLFCDRTDEIAGGLRLVSTKIQAHLHSIYSEKVQYFTKAPLLESVDRLALLTGNHSPAWNVQAMAWYLTVRSEHVGSYVTCEAQAELRPTPFVQINYWNWLGAQFRRLGNQHLTSRSNQIKLCVSVGPEMVHIDPKPTRRHGTQLDILYLQPQQHVTCSITSDKFRSINFTLYPIVDQELTEAETGGLSRIFSWLDRARFPLSWTQVYGRNYVRILVPPNPDVCGNYFASCILNGTEASANLLLVIQSTPVAFVPERGQLRIRYTWLVFALPVLGLLYFYLRKCMEERHQRNEAHLALLFRDIGTDISSEGDDYQ
ncbi:hypothetical protein EG68_00410 [Paragonimus skrjabini miyazakii]|uniref:Ig-like domain-containing protein n=1 Tax=Paragonimus skrjabini miyazakii TaxID=59628 RepID=A0A8S9Z9B6_9TREM|nr:hypothetical protein EG68_00410 [Paragonimus skrjabini miyazakii]